MSRSTEGQVLRRVPWYVCFDLQLDQILNVLNIDSGLSSPLPLSDFESESTRTDTGN
jgi:hypothetical protein